MNDTQTGYSRVEVALKAALVISVLGFIVMVADRSHIAPTPSHPLSATPVATYDGGGTAARGEGTSTAAEDSARSTGRPSNAAPAKLYPEMSPDAVSDEGGHPPSF